MGPIGYTLLMGQVCASHILVRHLFLHIHLRLHIFVFFVFLWSLAIYYLLRNSLVTMTSLLNFTRLIFLSRTEPPRTYSLKVTAAVVYMSWMRLPCLAYSLVFEFRHLRGTRVLAIRPSRLSVLFFIVMSFLQCLVPKVSPFVMRVNKGRVISFLFFSSSQVIKSPLELMFSDVWGPAQKP
jgi:hypothetical protein